MITTIPRIVIADDDPDDLEMLQQTFLAELSDIELHCFLNGKDIIHFLKQQPQDHLPHLIVIDYNMPAARGPEILEQLRREPSLRAVPTIVWSTCCDELIDQECRLRGAQAIYEKPITYHQLRLLTRLMLRFSSLPLVT